MGEKEGKAEKEKKAVDGGEKKKEEVPSLVVLKVDMHCEGCASKIKRSLKGFEGVEGVTIDMASNKLTVVGKADPWMLKERLEAKIHKKVEFISPANPPKLSSKKPPVPDDQPKKPKEASSVVLKIRLHCDGCIQRIKKTILKVKGVQEVSVEAQKDLVTVKGTMDVNSLPTYLKNKLKRGVEIVPAKSGGGGGGDKKEKAGGGGEKKEEGGGGGEKKEKGDKKEKAGGGGEKKEEGGGGGEKKKETGGEGGGKKVAPATVVAPPPSVETNKMQYYGPYGYRAEMMHAPQLFSDENPNACSVM